MYFLIEHTQEDYDRHDFKIIGFSKNENELEERCNQLTLLNNEEIDFYKTVELSVKKYQLDLNYQWQLYLLTNNPNREDYYNIKLDFGKSILEKIDSKSKKYIGMRQDGDFYCSRSNRFYEIVELEKSFYE